MATPQNLSDKSQNNVDAANTAQPEGVGRRRGKYRAM